MKTVSRNRTHLTVNCQTIEIVCAEGGGEKKTEKVNNIVNQS